MGETPNKIPLSERLFWAFRDYLIDINLIKSERWSRLTVAEYEALCKWRYSVFADELAAQIDDKDPPMLRGDMRPAVAQGE